MNRARRGLLVAVSLPVLIIIIAAGWQATKIVTISVAYKAKLVCSGIFVSKRDPNALLADLEVDDLSVLKYIGVSIDRRTRTVTANALGFLRRRAAYRDGLGCTLLLDGLTPPASLAASTVVEPPGARIHSVDALTRRRTTESVGHDELAAVIRHAFLEPDPQSRRVCKARRSTGFSRNQKALRSWTAERAFSMLPKPVSAIVGVRSPRSFSRRSSSKPSMRGMTKSATMTSALKALSRSSASCPSAATCVSKSQSESMAAKAERCRSSSSTMRIRPGTVGRRGIASHSSALATGFSDLNGEWVSASCWRYMR